MLLSITTTHEPASDLGYLLAKHPERCQTFDLAYGQAHVFYPEVSAHRCTAALLLDLDPVGLVRGRRSHGPATLAQYVNDRPYVASSFFSVAIAQVLGSALGGRCTARPELAETAIPLSAELQPVPARGGEPLIRSLFEPLGYRVEAERLPLDPAFPDWGESRYYAVSLEGTVRLSELLSHLYVLIPVLDHEKHYWVDRSELEKLMAKGEGWLDEHPERELVARRYLFRQPRLAREAIARLMEDDLADPDEQAEEQTRAEDRLEEPLSLHDQRHGAVLAVLRDAKARRVLDLGCGEGKLLKALLRDRSFAEIVGVDVSPRALDVAERRLGFERMPPTQRERITLRQGSLLYRDARFSGFDAACLVEVIEHLDPPRLAGLERTVFEFAQPPTVVVTTPNREYNVLFEGLAEDRLRHGDHRFEWTRSEFRAWADRIAHAHEYEVRYLSVGEEHPEHGAPTQVAVFAR